jgi:RNA polymerase sigma factor for flagellar operon FliA
MADREVGGIKKMPVHEIKSMATPAERQVPPPVLVRSVSSENSSSQTEEPGIPFADLDPTARERILLEHIPVVRYIARRIHERLPQHLEMEDLISAGMVGLMDAFNKFDAAKNIQFRTYAQFRIRGAILDSLRTLDWSPRDLRRKGRAIEEAIRALSNRLGRAPSESEIAGELDMPLSEYQQLLGELKGLEIGSLHVEHSEDSAEDELAYVPNPPEEDPLFYCLQGEMRARLADAIVKLPERERLVLTLYYHEEMTMKEIGLTLDVVESRVSQIHSSAVLHLRAELAGLKNGNGTSAASGTSKKDSKARTGVRADMGSARETRSRNFESLNSISALGTIEQRNEIR